MAVSNIDLIEFWVWGNQKRRKTKLPDLPIATREKMKKAFNECHRAVLNCEDDTGRKRCELFKELPDKRVNYLFYCFLILREDA